MDTIKSNSAKRRIVIESIMVFFVAISPFLYKIYDYLPDASGESVSVLGLTITSHGFPDVSTFIWFIMGKIVPLYLLVFWFFTTKGWWYHIILIPIAMYSFQIFEVLFSYDDDIDTKNLLWLLPICMIIIPFVYLIRIKLYDKYVHGIDLEALEAELEDIKVQPKVSKIVKSVRRYEDLEEDMEGISSPDLPKPDGLESCLKDIQQKIKGWLHVSV